MVLRNNKSNNNSGTFTTTKQKKTIGKNNISKNPKKQTQLYASYSQNTYKKDNGG